ncbi:hypothetical protein HN709_03775 [Candidatus Peregrinibacteria bacterium]|jgi:flagellar biosynthesis component FlhA|nr:hypothetical protein [Candidatus Peregrinibacteria bacterium]MBT7736784.1 hypothetical protein [Candidatus Peregrinibacteria bacterium]
MDIDKIPVLGKVRRTMSAMAVNFVFLAIICLILGIVIPLYPQVLDLLISATLIVTSVIFLSIAWHLHSAKKKYIDWVE